MTDLLERVRQQAAGMFARNDYPADMLPDGSGYRLIVGSTETVIDFREWHDDVVITFNAVLLVLDAPQRGRARALMLERVNELNQSIPLGKVYVTDADIDDETPPMIELEYQILGKNLDLTEFIPALEHLAFLADELDDELKADLGGRRFFEDEGEDAVDA